MPHKMKKKLKSMSLWALPAGRKMAAAGFFYIIIMSLLALIKNTESVQSESKRQKTKTKSKKRQRHLKSHLDTTTQ